MSDHLVRVLRDDELRTAHTLFRGALHAPPLADEHWELRRRGYQPGTVLGAFDGDTDAETLIGTANSSDATLRVPGGADVAFRAVTGVGVRADRTRRGVLTGLMRAQLADFAERGVVSAGLHASEGAIYGRYGYGPAIVERTCVVQRSRAAFRPEVPAGGRVELLDAEQARASLPEVYDALPLRLGMVTRSPFWWDMVESDRRSPGGEAVRVAVHHGVDGADGFAIYRVDRKPGGVGELTVSDLHYADSSAFAGLARFLVSMDLVDEVRLVGRALDEPWELLCTDPRACTVVASGDGLWLRLVDVQAALAARERAAEPLVLEVDDPVLTENSGRYRVTPDAVARTEQPADVVLGVDALAMAYLGGWRPSALAQAGRVLVRDDHAASQVDSLFRTRSSPWCGTFF